MTLGAGHEQAAAVPGDNWRVPRLAGRHIDLPNGLSRVPVQGVQVSLAADDDQAVSDQGGGSGGQRIAVAVEAEALLAAADVDGIELVVGEGEDRAVPNARVLGRRALPDSRHPELVGSLAVESIEPAVRGADQNHTAFHARALQVGNVLGGRQPLLLDRSRAGVDRDKDVVHERVVIPTPISGSSQEEDRTAGAGEVGNGRRDRMLPDVRGVVDAHSVEVVGARYDEHVARYVRRGAEFPGLGDEGLLPRAGTRFAHGFLSMASEFCGTGYQVRSATTTFSSLVNHATLSRSGATAMPCGSPAIPGASCAAIW